MKSTPQLTKWFVLLAMAIFIVSCGKNNDDNTTVPEQNNQENVTEENTPEDTENTDNTGTTIDVVDLAASVEALTDLVDAIIAADAGLLDTLATEEDITVFAPTNAAFEALFARLEGFDSLEDFDTAEEKELLAEILKYHIVINRSAPSSNLADGDELETLQSEVLTVSINEEIFIKDKTSLLAKIIGADNEASNGFVHMIDKVLLPQSVLEVLQIDGEEGNDGNTDGSVVDIVVQNENLSLLEEAVIAAGLVEALSTNGPYTIFAPSDEAISQLFELLGDTFNSFEDFSNPVEVLLLKKILEYHVVPQNLTSGDLVPGMLPTLDSGQTLEVIAQDGTFVLGDASNTNAILQNIDNVASNGVVHIIDKILISQDVADLLANIGVDVDNPPNGAPTIKDLVVTNEELAFLEEALRITGLLDTLGEEGPYTVFAPSNETLTFLFGLLGASVNGIEDFDLQYEIDILRDVLSYHVVPGNFQSNDLIPGNELETLLGDPIDIVEGPNGTALVDDTTLTAGFVLADLPANNGVIHIIDRILIPKTAIDAIIAETEDEIQEIMEYIEGNHVLQHAILMAGEEFQKVVIDGDPFTFFLPTNQAFLNLFDELEGIDSLIDFDTEEEQLLLGNILIYHCIPNTKVLSTNLSDGQTITTVQGEDIVISLANGVSVIDKTGQASNVTSADTEILNGVIHFIDKVLLPQEVLDKL